MSRANSCMTWVGLSLPWMNMLDDAARTVRNRAHLKCGGAILTLQWRSGLWGGRAMRLLVGDEIIETGRLCQLLMDFLQSKNKWWDELESLSCNFLHQRKIARIIFRATKLSDLRPWIMALSLCKSVPTQFKCLAGYEKFSTALVLFSEEKFFLSTRWKYENKNS